MLHASNLDTDNPSMPPEEKVAIFDNAMEYLKQYSSMTPEQVPVSSLEEYLAVTQRNLPDLYTFENELERLNKRQIRPPTIPIPKDAETEAEIDRYMDYQLALSKEYLMEVAQSRGIEPAKLSTYGAIFSSFQNVEKELPGILRRFRRSSNPTRILRELTKISLSRDQKLAVVNMFENAFQAGLREVSTVSKKLSNEKYSGTVDPRLTQMVQLLFGTYYEQLSSRGKKQIISELLDSPGVKSELGRFSIVIQNSGPQLQKALQVISREPWMDPKFKAIFEKLESGGKQVPWEIAKDIIEPGPSHHIFDRVSEKPLGVGTLGQVHEATYLVNGEPTRVAVKFVKPGSDWRMDEDERIFRKIAELIDGNPEYSSMGLPKVGPILEDVSKSNRVDMDLARMVAMQLLAAKEYKKRTRMKLDGATVAIEFSVPRIFETANNKILVQEFSSGVKPADLAEQAARNSPSDSSISSSEAKTVEQAGAKALTKLWLDKAVFGSGYFHADLHQGNLLIEVLSVDRSVSPPKIKVKIHLLDHGMNHIVERQEQLGFLSIGIATLAEDYKAIARIIYHLRDPSTAISKERWFELAAEKARELKASGRPIDAAEWFSWATHQGFRFPFKFAGLNRGALTVRSMVVQAGLDAEIGNQILLKLGLTHPLKLGRAVGMGPQRLSREGWGNLVGKSCEAIMGALRKPVPQ